jgi:hypothetical protein
MKMRKEKKKNDENEEQEEVEEEKKASGRGKHIISPLVYCGSSRSGRGSSGKRFL